MRVMKFTASYLLAYGAALALFVIVDAFGLRAWSAACDPQAEYVKASADAAIVTPEEIPKPDAIAPVNKELIFGKPRRGITRPRCELG